MTTEVGFFNIPEDIYHRRPELSQSGLKQILKAPAIYRWEQDNPTPSTAAMKVGSAAHRMILGTGPDIVTVPADLLSPDGGVRSKAAREWKALAELEGKLVVSQKEWDTVSAMADALHAHPVAGELFAKPGIAESAMIWQEQDGVFCRGMIDWLISDSNIIVDYKTSVDASKEKFQRAVWEYGYHIQDMFYRTGYEMLTNTIVDDFIFVVQEKTAPYLVSAYRLDAVALSIAQEQIQEGLLTYRACVENDVWPGYSDVIEELSLPRYAEALFEKEVELIL